MTEVSKKRTDLTPCLILVFSVLFNAEVCQAQIEPARAERGGSAEKLPVQPRRQGDLRRPTGGDPFQSLLKFVRQEQEVEFAKPLPAFPETVQGVKAIEQQFQATYPAKKELAIYTLDWETNLAAARERAKKENRPIFFIVVTNYTGPTNFLSGHC